MKKSILNFGKALNKIELKQIDGGNLSNFDCEEGEISIAVTDQNGCTNIYRGHWCSGVCYVCSV